MLEENTDKEPVKWCVSSLVSPKAVEPDWLISVIVVEIISKVFASMAPETINVPVTNIVSFTNVSLLEPPRSPLPELNCNEFVGPWAIASSGPPALDVKTTLLLLSRARKEEVSA